MKTCRQCRTQKPHAEFWRNGTKSDGSQMLASRCIPCAREAKGRARKVGRKPRVALAIVDFLSIECGWWNAPAIAHRISAHERGVQRRLEELVRSGAIRRRETMEGAYEYQADPWWMSESA